VRIGSLLGEQDRDQRKTSWDRVEEPVDSSGLPAEKKKEFIKVTSWLKLLTDRRAQILARVCDDYLIAPPMAAARP